MNRIEQHLLRITVHKLEYQDLVHESLKLRAELSELCEGTK